MKKKLKSITKTKLFFLTAITYLMLGNVQTYAAVASSYLNLKIYEGTKNLVAAATGALTALIIGLTIFHGTKNVIAWQNALDEEKPRKFKTVVNTIAIGVIGSTFSGIVTWVMAFYA